MEQLLSVVGVEYGTRDIRNDRIRQAYEHGYTVKEIAGNLGLHCTTISKVAGDGT